MTVHPGSRIWIPCEVKPGPFSDERMVRVETPDGPWLGFVELHHLREPLERGNTEILATVTEVQADEFLARFPGHATQTLLFRGEVARAAQVGSLQA